MAETRIEKYREYRKSIISGGSVLKTPIETSLKTTSEEENSSLTEQEAVFLKKINTNKLLGTMLYIAFLLVIIIPLVIFAIKLF